MGRHTNFLLIINLDYKYSFEKSSFSISFILLHWQIANENSKMCHNKSLNVLRGLKISAKIVSLNIRNDIRIGGIKLPRILLILLFSGSIISMYILSIRFCVVHNFDLNVIAAPISVFWGCMQIELMYLSFSQQNYRLVETLDQFQSLIYESNLTF